MRRLALLILTALVALAPAAYGVGITIISGAGSSIGSRSDFSGITDSQGHNVTSLPDSGTVNSSAGQSSGATGFDLSNAAFQITFEQILPSGESGANGEGSAVIFFMPDADVEYVLDGAFTTVSPSGTFVSLSGALFDATDNVELFENFQDSEQTANESFALGSSNGDLMNSLVGSLTGTLLAGHTYVFSTRTRMQKQSATDTDLTASGHINLTFVPEPGVAALLGLGLTAAAAAGGVRGSHLTHREYSSRAQRNALRHGDLLES